MKLSFLNCIALVGLLGCCSGTRADATKVAPRRNALPVATEVIVRDIKGQVEYAYDSTGWQKLEKDKLLKPGATIRTLDDSAVLLKLEHQSTFYKVNSNTVLQLTPETPADEVNAASRLARLRAQRVARISSARLSGTRLASHDSE